MMVRIDKWLCEEALKDKFPNLFRLEKDKLASVADRCDMQGEGALVFWNKVKAVLADSVVAEREICLDAVNRVQLSEVQDKWQWLGDDSGSFSVKSANFWLQKTDQQRAEFVLEWCNIVTLHQSVGLNGVKKIALQGIIFTAMWLIWKSRNERIFSDRNRKVMEVIAEIKVLSFLWFRNKYKNACIDWK
ncbi:hypothetical protein Hanom_Chr05g00444771 [Helianthus anomalus]